MKYKLEIGLIFFLLLFFVSIDDPLIHAGMILKKIPNLKTPDQYTCIAGVVPETARVLFFSKPDGALDWNAYNFLFTKSQYSLVPRVLTYRESGSIDLLSEFKWFLAVHIDAQALEPMIRQSGLQIVKSCDKTILLKKSTD